jgi:hypothetical protein
VGVGAIILASFAALWWIMGTAASHRGSLPMDAAAVVISSILIVIGLHLAGRESSAPEQRRHRGRLVGIASGAEGLAILVAINILANVRRQDLAAPVIAIVVGLHFFALARWLPARLYYATGAALAIVGISGIAVTDLNVRYYAVGAGAAWVLWLTCGIVLWRGYRGKASS